jgi:hypothetical protein
MSALRPGLALCLVAASLVPARAEAQSRAEEGRRATLIQQATQARSRGEWSRVVGLLQQVVDIRATASIRLGLAGAYQELGQHSEAASQAALCMQAAPADRDLREEQRTAMVDTCGQVLREATAHLATVTVETVPEGVQGASLLVDGESVDGFAPGRPFYLTPGRRRLRLRASGQEEAETTETLRAGATRTVRLTLRPVLGAVANSGNSGPLQGATQSESPSAAPWVIGSLGIVAAGAGAVFLGIALAKSDECQGDTSSSVCRDANATITLGNNLGAVLTVSGGIAVAISAVWLLARGRSGEPRTTSWTPSANGLTVTF